MFAHVIEGGEGSAALLLEFLRAAGMCVTWWILSARIFLLGMVGEPGIEGSEVVGQQG